MLVINARFLTQEITGVQRYAIEISLMLKKIYPDITFVTPKNIIHKELADELGSVVIGKNSGHLWEQIDLPFYLNSIGCPLLINLANTAPLFYSNKITQLHDIAYERFPQTFSWKFRFWYKMLIPKLLYSSKHILTDSVFSKNEIIDCYNVSELDISIIHCSISDFFRSSLGDNGRSDCVEKYILAVSSLNYQKNFSSLVSAFNQLDDENIKLYLVGATSGSFQDLGFFDEISKNERIIFKGRVSDIELRSLYSGALCFVYPSLYEGFGIPPLEAQGCGCPVIVSNVASLPEVCENSALYCDPYDVSNITKKMKLAVNDEMLREELIRSGYINIERFSWENSARKILEIAKGYL